jgi:exopolysaccharide biosynthesis polyprenyl glycosylphosphotransferase
MLRQFSPRRIIGLFLFDWLGTLAMLALAGALRGSLGGLPQPFAGLLDLLGIPFSGAWSTLPLGDILPLQVFVLVSLIWPFFLVTFSVYDGRANDTLKTELLNVFLAVCVAAMTFAGALYFSYRDTPRVLFLLFVGFDLALLLGGRVVLWVYRRTTRRGRHTAARRVAIIAGAGDVGRQALAEIEKYAWSDVRVVGFVDDDPALRGSAVDGVPVLGGTVDLPAIISGYGVQDAIVALPLHAHERMIDTCLLLQALKVRVYVIPDLFALSFPSAQLDGFGGIPVIDLGMPGIYGQRRALKRIFDVAAVTIGLALISPVMLLVALAIKLDSHGPVFFRQQRVGEHGRTFTMLKFRSMRVDADPAAHKAHVERLIKENVDAGQAGGSLKMADDPRITRVGQLIRKTSVDELPQLLNVLRGEMSLVGPRPPVPYEVDLYQDWHKRRFEAIPGISGLWQVEGRNRVSFDEMVRLDIEYIENQSLWTDIKILLKTPLAVITGRGAG